jgi:hypothetical protein
MTARARLIVRGFGCIVRSLAAVLPPLASVLLPLAVVLGVPTSATAQEVPEPQLAERCTAAELRHFDFWLGEWDVRNADGELLGSNEITQVARGCGLLENWRGRAGGRGMSLNAYDSATQKWTQRWVGDGASLWLEGGLENGSMVLTGTRKRDTPNGPVLDRLTWTPLPDGRVLQRWEISTDDGEQWRAVFEGYYEKRT